MIFVYVSVLVGFLTVTISAYKSDTFPPIAKVYKHWDIDNVVKTCYEKTGVDKKELQELEMTTDLEHLPNSHALKAYLRCFGEMSGSVDPKSNKVILTKFLDFWEDLTQDEQEIYLKLGKGCFKRAKTVADHLEHSYIIVVCVKQNDNEHFYLFYHLLAAISSAAK